MTEKTDHNHLSAGNGDVLRHYADTYCEGWCKDAPANANFDDCGGCRARLALNEPQGVLTLDWIEKFASEAKPFGYVKDNEAIDKFLTSVRAALALSRPERAKQEPSK
jgi:hypothetical protein